MIQDDLEAAGIINRDANGELITLDECGLFYDFHGLRHTFATMLNKAKVLLASAQKLMRHSIPKLTAKVHTHVLVDTKAEAIDMLPAITAAQPTKNMDRSVDSCENDFDRRIATYSDGGAGGKQGVSVMLGNEKAPVPQGRTGALVAGTRPATRTRDLLIKSETDKNRNVIFDKALPQPKKARTVQRTVCHE